MLSRMFVFAFLQGGKKNMAKQSVSNTPRFLILHEKCRVLAFFNFWGQASCEFWCFPRLTNLNVETCSCYTAWTSMERFRKLGLLNQMIWLSTQKMKFHGEIACQSGLCSFTIFVFFDFSLTKRALQKPCEQGGWYYKWAVMMRFF